MANFALIHTRKRNLAREIIKNRWIYLMMLPGMLYFLFNNYLPMAGITIYLTLSVTPTQTSMPCGICGGNKTERKGDSSEKSKKEMDLSDYRGFGCVCCRVDSSASCAGIQCRIYFARRRPAAIPGDSQRPGNRVYCWWFWNDPADNGDLRQSPLS